MTAAPSRTDLVVWLDPGPHGAPPELVRALEQAVRLVVVPRTGRRRAQVAALLAPAVAVLGRVRSVLPEAVLLAVPDAPPSRAFSDVAQWEGVHVLPPGAPPALVVQEVLALARPGEHARPPAVHLPAAREAVEPPAADAVVDDVAGLLGTTREALLAELLRSDALRALAAERGVGAAVAERVGRTGAPAASRP